MYSKTYLARIYLHEEIKKYRLSESEKAGYDIGSQAAAMNWVEKYGADFREHWEQEDDM